MKFMILEMLYLMSIYNYILMRVEKKLVYQHLLDIYIHIPKNDL